MIVHHHHEGHWFHVEFPEGTRVFRSRDAGIGMLIVPWEGSEIPVFDEPSELIADLAHAGRYGLRLVRIEQADESSDSA
jgi:hypothetical protein